MKKNWTLRVAVLMVALTLITACFVSGTYAKYITSGSADDTARVAKFGVVVEADGGLFAPEYATDDTTLDEKEAEIVGEYSVQASTKDNLVAPGTKSDEEGLSFAVSGTPEVAVRIDYTIEIVAEGWNLPVEPAPAPTDEIVVTAEPTGEAAEATAEAIATAAAKETEEGKEEEVGEEYFPIIFTVNGVQYKVGTEEPEVDDVDGPTVSKAKAGAEIKLYDNLEALIAGIQEDVEALSAVYAANTDLSTVDASLSIGWEWPFYVSDENDVKDTALGDQAAADNAATLEVTVGITVTQID